MNKLIISYPDFRLNEVMDPEQFDTNNAEIVGKINEVVDLLTVGIRTENIADNVVTDKKLGTRTISSTVPTSNVGELTVLLGNLANRLSAITGIADWKTSPIQSIVQIKNTADTDRINFVNHTNDGVKHITSTERNNWEAHRGDAVRHITSVERGVWNDHKNASAPHAGHLTASHYSANSTHHDNRYYTKAELTPYLQGGDTSIKYEVYTILNADNGDSTFTYVDTKGQEHVGELTAEGWQVFQLRDGYYQLGMNRIKAYINDTLLRNVASGGLKELSETQVALTSPEGNGAEITIEYFERVGISGEHNIIIHEQQPPDSDGMMLWLKVVG